MALWKRQWWKGVVDDVGFGWRLMGRDWPFTALSVTILAVGIAVSTTLYSVIYEVVIKPLPYHEPARVVRVSEQRPDGVAAGRDAVLSSLTFHAWLDAVPETLDALAGYEFREHALVLRDGTIRVNGVAVTGELFDVLGIAPARGRFLGPEDAEYGANSAVVISDAFWRDVLASRSDIVGSTLLLDGTFHTVVGVAPPEFFFPDRQTVLWTTFAPPRASAADENPRVTAFFCLGRLKPHVSVERAATEGTLVAQRFTRSALGRDLLFGAGRAPTVRVRTMAEESTSDLRPALAVLAFGVALLFVAACTNVSNLMVGRQLKRAPEFLVRSAVGATRARLVRQLVTENLLTSVLSGLVGVALGWVVLNAVKSMVGGFLTSANDARMDLRALCVAFVLVLVIAALCGLMPALGSTRRGVPGRTDRGALLDNNVSFRNVQAFREILTVVQAGVAVSLLIVATLLARSFVHLISIDPGYSPDNVLTIGIRIPGGYEVSDEKKRVMASVLEWLRPLGAVSAAGASNMVPLDNRAYLAGFPVRPIPEIQGRPVVAAALRYAITPGYAEAIRLRLLDGRLFDERDAASAVLRMIVNEEFARRYLPSDPVGTRLIWGEPAEAEVVGVVANVLKDGSDRGARPEFYVPMASRDRLGADVLLVVRTEGEVRYLPSMLMDYVRDLNVHATVEVTSLADRLSLSVARPRFAAFVIGAFATVSVLLSIAGLYGVICLGIIRRQREFGVRSALGATRADLVRLGLERGFRAAGLGLVCGVVGSAIIVTPLLRGVLVGVERLDPLTFVGAPVLLAFATFAACLVPALRATAGQPARALRSQ